MLIVMIQWKLLQVKAKVAADLLNCRGPMSDQCSKDSVFNRYKILLMNENQRSFLHNEMAPGGAGGVCCQLKCSEVAQSKR